MDLKKSARGLASDVQTGSLPTPLHIRRTHVHTGLFIHLLYTDLRYSILFVCTQG